MTREEQIARLRQLESERETVAKAFAGTKHWYVNWHFRRVERVTEDYATVTYHSAELGAPACIKLAECHRTEEIEDGDYFKRGVFATKREATAALVEWLETCAADYDCDADECRKKAAKLRGAA